MAKVEKWRGYHVRVTTLEKILGVRLASFRDMYHCDFEGESISIRLPRERWDYYGVREALESLGLGGQGAVYINL